MLFQLVSPLNPPERPGGRPKHPASATSSSLDPHPLGEISARLLLPIFPCWIPLTCVPQAHPATEPHRKTWRQTKHPSSATIPFMDLYLLGESLGTVPSGRGRDPHLYPLEEEMRRWQYKNTFNNRKTYMTPPPVCRDSTPARPEHPSADEVLCVVVYSFNISTLDTKSGILLSLVFVLFLRQVSLCSTSCLRTSSCRQG